MPVFDGHEITYIRWTEIESTQKFTHFIERPGYLIGVSSHCGHFIELTENNCCNILSEAIVDNKHITGTNRICEILGYSPRNIIADIKSGKIKRRIKIINNNFDYNLNLINKTEREIRYGDRQYIRDLMSGEVVNINLIQDVIPHIPLHSNDVELATINFKNSDTENDVIIGVFKAVDGEHRYGTDIPSYYAREKTADIIDEFFGFNIVPPSVIREVNGRIGSMQLFIPHSLYSMGSNTKYDINEMIGDDFYKVAIFDYITQQSDRKGDNYMVRKKDPQKLIAIDNSMSFENGDAYCCTMGPLEYLTSYENPDHIAGEENYSLPKKVEIPEVYIDLLKEKLSQKEELNSKLRDFKRIHEWITDETGKEKLLTLPNPIQDLSEEHIERMWQRVEEMIKYGVFISTENREFVFGGG